MSNYQWEAPVSDSKVYPIVAAGNYVGRLYSIVDLGTQHFEYDTGPKDERKMEFTFELPTETTVFKEGEEPKPFVVSARYTLSFHEKANLTKLLKSWQGKSPTGDELRSGSWKLPDLLGLPALVSVIHSEPNSKGKVYANISSVTPLVKGMECPAQVNPTVWFFLGYQGRAEDLDNKTYDELRPFVKEMIAKSPEFQCCREQQLKQAQPDFVK